MAWIGVDPHKRIHQAAALDADGTITTKLVPNTAEGWVDLLAWAQAWPERQWAIEGAASLGYGAAQFLVEHGEAVREVCPRWTARWRRSARKPGKSDTLDALAIARLLREEALEAGVDPFAAPVTSSDRLAMLLERIDELPLASHALRGNPSA
ncbi:MAG: transposase, partial [Luteitalea sp.]|nr:transposase [Luteitalea sp.]